QVECATRFHASSGREQIKAKCLNHHECVNREGEAKFCFGKSSWGSSISPLTLQSNTQPSLTVLPPSSRELSEKKSATLLCLANQGFPSDWSLQWTVDGHSRTNGVTKTPYLLDSTGLYSWSSTLTLSEAEWSSVGTVVCEATHSSQAPVTKALKKSECPE
uniref:Immunoglobulin light 1 constant 3 n=1 Tax=Lepisosteus oculatus TaxID=7918 RepID=W5LXH7_LEPOC